jgi:hypothetical protein
MKAITPVIAPAVCLTSAPILLSPWQGYGVFAAWTAVLLISAAYLLQRRDA